MMTILESTINPFKGVQLKPEALPESAEEFRTRLQESLTTWGAEGYRVFER